MYYEKVGVIHSGKPRSHSCCRIYCALVFTCIDGLQIVRTIPRAKVPIVKIWDPVL